MSTSSGFDIVLQSVECHRKSNAESIHRPFPLYDDTLRVVLRYLSLHELHTAVQLSAQWYRLIQTMKPLGLIYSKFQASLEHSPTHSAVARHVAVVACLDNVLYTTPTLLSSLADRLSHLRELHFYSPDHISSKYYSIQTPIRMPTSLEKVSVTVELNHLHLLLSAVSQLPQLHDLKLHIAGKATVTPRSVDFSLLIPGISLPSLTALFIEFETVPWNRSDWIAYCASPEPLSSSLLNFLRQSTSLQKLDVLYHGIFLPYSIDQLTEATADNKLCPLIQSGNLIDIDLSPATLDFHLLQSLTRIPSLTELVLEKFRDDQLEPENMKLLQKLPHLTSLRMYIFKPYPIELLCIAARSAPKLRRFHFSNSELTSEQLDDILSHLPHLTDLFLMACTNLSSLKPLLHYELPQRLTRLAVTRSDRLPLSDITECIFPLQLLELLSLDSSFHEQASEELIQQLTIGSNKCRLPKLKELTFH